MTMDIAQIAASAVAFVGPILANVAVEEAGKTVIQKLWQKIRDGLVSKNETSVIETLRCLEKSPGDIRLKAELEARLANVLAANPDLRYELAHLIEEAGGWITLPQGSPVPSPLALHQLPPDIRVAVSL